jgi:ribonucleoside-diphosphate reductase alpha chain
MFSSAEPFAEAVSERVWDAKYRHYEAGVAQDLTVQDTWRRVAHTLAGVEAADRASWEARFFSILENFRFLPGGRILAGAGTGHKVTLFNCFVMGTVPDSLDGIFESLKEGALTMQQGGGVGYDFSALRPCGDPARAAASIASGPVSFMKIWDATCATLVSTSARRGAMMATLRCDHPDIEAFVEAKRHPDWLRHFNLSVLVSEAFMRAVEEDTDWPLVFPRADDETRPGEIVLRPWSGSRDPVPCRVYRQVRARELWQRILRGAYDCAEPGVIFIDRVNQENNLAYCETLGATNPCGEIPLPAYGACNLGAVNLATLVREPFSPGAFLDWDALGETVRLAVRLLDNVYEASNFPLARQAHTASQSRRLGLGLTGLGDALVMLGLAYDSQAAVDLGGRIMASLCHGAYRASVDLARERGSFPAFRRDAYLASPFVQRLPEDIRAGIARYGIRNSHLTAIAPTGTISLLANNVSSGLEPVFDWQYRRRMRGMNGQFDQVTVTDLAYRLYRRDHGEAPLPAAFRRATDITPEWHLRMQAALQRHVDNAISKTINIPANYDFEDFQNVYRQAYEHGLKGCTAFRPNPVTGEILVSPPDAASVECCNP